MADFNEPTTGTLYTAILTALKGRDVDAITLCSSVPTNIPTGAIRYNRSTNLFEEYNGSSWVVKSLAVAGGGTGATTAAGARTNLGLGSIATQNSNGVAITGGTISGLTAFSIAANLVMGNNAYDLGANASKVRALYLGTGLLVPVGADKYLTA